MLLIDNDVQAQSITMMECMDAQRNAFVALAKGLAAHRPRIDVLMPCSKKDSYFRWGSMEGAYDGVFASRIKSDICSWPNTSNGEWTEEIYNTEPGTYCGLVFLFSTDNGAPLAILNDGFIQHFRVGGGAGIGTSILSRADSKVLGVLGSGGMARSYMEAVCNIRVIEKVKVFSPTRSNRVKFAKDMEEKLDVAVEPVPEARLAVSGADILVCTTDSMVPVFDAEWLEPGMHVVNVGPQEISEESFRRFDLVIRQGEVGAQSLIESEVVRKDIKNSPVAYVAGNELERSILPTVTKGKQGWDRKYPFLVDVLSGDSPGRTTDNQITLYHNIGNQGLQFAAVGGVIYKNCVEQGLGQELPSSWFLQNVRN